MQKKKNSVKILEKKLEKELHWDKTNNITLFYSKAF